MTASNIRALIIAVLAAGGVLGGAIVWQSTHPDAPVPQPIAKLTAPPSLNPPKASPQPKPSVEIKAPPEGQKMGGGLTKGPPPKPEPAAGHGEPPHFDVVRVEPSGDAVLAGKGDPDAKVALMASGKVLAETKADANGQFVLVPPTLKPGSYDLTLRQTPAGKAAVGSKQNIAVSVPAKPNGEVMVALAEPGKPTRLLSGPPEAKDAAKPAPSVKAAPSVPQPPAKTATAAPAKPETAVAPPAAIKPAGPDLAIRSVELENGNGFFATGLAAPGTHIQIYLNGTHLAAVVAGDGGEWSVHVKKGLAGGHYIVRADASREGREVAARVEVPFDVPVEMAAAKSKEAKPKETKPAEPAAEAPKPNEPPPAVATHLPHDAPPLPNVPPAQVAEAPVVEATAEDPKPNEPPASVAARMPHEAPPLPNVPPETPAPDRTAATPSVTVLSTPPEPPAVVPTPRPDVAAAAKAASAAAPKVAPPALAVAKPTPPPEQRPAPPPAKMAVSPPRPASAPPTLAAAAPAVAPPKQAEIAKSAPTAPVSPVAPPVAAPARPAPDAANAVIEQVETATVVIGDNLWNISRARLGVGYRYTQIYAANSAQIRDPKLIYPGQVFVVPPK